jgi:hypothetical protein
VDQPSDLAPGHRPARGPSAGPFIAALGPLARPGAGAPLSSGVPPVQVARLVGFRLLPEREFAGYAEPKTTLLRSPGHHAEWIEACKTGKPTGTNFDYSAQLTELVLLGNVALRAGRRIEWDAAGLRITNGSLDDPFIHREYRPGWAL